VSEYAIGPLGFGTEDSLARIHSGRRTNLLGLPIRCRGPGTASLRRGRSLKRWGGHRKLDAGTARHADRV
jgi:hypothetical protein